LDGAIFVSDPAAEPEDQEENMLEENGRQPLYKLDFASDAAMAGWIYNGEEPYDPIVGGGCCGPKSFYVKNGNWESPLVPVTPFEYYKVSFCTKAKDPAWWAAVYYDNEGNPLVADHYWGIDGSEDWARTEYCTKAKINASGLRSRFHAPQEPYSVGGLEVEQITREEAARWGDAEYAKLPPVNYTPRADRWARIPKSISSIQNGGKLRVVMLGDSICNDTSNGPFDTWIERMYPNLKLEVVSSVEGGKGCWFYKEENRVESHVLRYNPDLLIIAGISQNNDAESVRQVVRQVREKATPEIMLMSPVMSDLNDPITSPSWVYEVDGSGDTFRDRLYRVAEDEGLEFFDITGPWGDYVSYCGEPVSWFRRDALHANMRGAIVLSKIVEKYFSPK
jgi:hypothetical protein